MPEDFGRDIGATERMVREWQERAAEKAEKFGRMQQQIQQISATESSKDGAIQVTVGSGGMLESLQLLEAASNRPMAKLGAEIMRMVQAAQAKIPELMQQAVADTVGLEDTAAQHVLGQARKYFPEPPEDEPEPERTSNLREMQVPMEDDYEEPQRRQAPVPPQRPAAPPREQQPPRRPADDFDDDDFGSGSFLR
ncbi:YbaB/EbfC DNA-binding family protein [Saccharopolyspora antimicrobica]|uniref:YbaB/EbfC DNA-binding family protein n=1 Tax=Saccharopolyspora antimicrobica TaxID=455193 RepID=A0A1I5DP19_9PSEU|nr:YbaB/EbfC family nucleoid-associated protein [Saccharopolyspora antimicrobica]RKT85045.1 YbaB/EbfC DNA-binding family protein [Saccharopolyspora antimicrobica]SFO00850.1 YbaB/EbfC DNA-binding family protein [Saccharopolyspora antimicrobica]